MAAGPLRLKYGMEPGAELTSVQFAELWNRVIDDFTRLVPVVVTGDGAGDMDFPWKTLATPFDDGNGTPRLWRIDVSLGTVNDLPPPVIYKATGDPRGWVPPDNYPPRTANSPIIERSLAELDRPWLLLATPKPNTPAVNTDQFQPVSDYARPAYFRTEAMWEKLLLQSSVFLTSVTTDASSINIPTEYLGRLAAAIRLTAGPLPSIAIGSLQGQLELARLFLLRDPKDQDGSQDQIMVRQEAYYCVVGELIEPQNAVTVDTPIGPISTNPDNSGAEYEFWTA